MKELRFAWKITIPILFTYVFIGIAFGVLMAEAGYGALWSAASALFVYAGSLQLVLVPLLKSGASLFSIAVMALFLNARHIFYGVGFIEQFRKMGWRYPYMVLSLTDETYSILCSVRYEAGLDEDRASFYIALLNHCYWIAGCLIGSLAGNLLPWDMTGIDFSATAFFLVVVVNQWTEKNRRGPALIGLLSALIFYVLLGAEQFLIPALTVAAVALVAAKDLLERKGGGLHAS